jgi:hypothetical protein
MALDRRTIVTTRDRRVREILEQKKQQEAVNGLYLYPQGGKRPLTEALQDGAWAGQRCFLIGGGPSLLGFDFEKLRGERTIAVNRSFEAVPFADILFSMDNIFYQHVKKAAFGQALRTAYLNFKGLRVWLDTTNYPYGPEVFYIRAFLTYNYPPTIRGGIFSGTNSGYGALMLAVALKARPIYLLGYDMKHAGSRTHHHKGYARKQSPKQLERFITHFNAVAPDLRRHGVEIYNLNPASALRCFEFRSITEVLPDAHDTGPAPGSGPQREAFALLGP